MLRRSFVQGLGLLIATPALSLPLTMKPEVWELRYRVRYRRKYLGTAYEFTGSFRGKHYHWTEVVEGDELPRTNPIVAGIEKRANAAIDKAIKRVVHRRNGLTEL